MASHRIASSEFASRAASCVAEVRACVRVLHCVFVLLAGLSSLTLSPASAEHRPHSQPCLSAAEAKIFGSGTARRPCSCCTLRLLYIRGQLQQQGSSVRLAPAVSRHLAVALAVAGSGWQWRPGRVSFPRARFGLALTSCFRPCARR